MKNLRFVYDVVLKKGGDFFSLVLFNCHLYDSEYDRIVTVLRNKQMAFIVSLV